MSIASRLKTPLGDWPKSLDKLVQTVLSASGAEHTSRANLAVAFIKDHVEREQQKGLV